MTDLKILEQLLNGYYLESEEIERARQILHRLNTQLKNRK